MPFDQHKALLVIQQQLKELDAIYQDTMEMSLNTVAGTERVAKWRVRTIALLADSVSKAIVRTRHLATRSVPDTVFNDPSIVSR